MRRWLGVVALGFVCGSAIAEAFYWHHRAADAESNFAPALRLEHAEASLLFEVGIVCRFDDADLNVVCEHLQDQASPSPQVETEEQ